MTDRRTILRGGAALAMVTLLPRPLWATAEEVEAAIVEIFGAKPWEEGPIILDVPPLAETGNSVPVSVRVDSEEQVVRLALFSLGNPRPRHALVRFGPAAAEAALATNIRLNGTQDISCVAELADGRLWRVDRTVRVVVGACNALGARY